MSKQLFNLNDKFALVAKTKSGKSYLGKMIQKAYPRKIIIDSTYEYTDQDGLIVYGFKDFASAIAHVSDLDQYTIIFRFNHEEKNDEEIFEEICRLVFYLGDTFFVIEEVHLHSSTHKMNHWLLKIATTGSHQGIGYLLTTQRPSLIHKTLLTQCDHVFIGSLIDQSDILYIKGFCGDRAKVLSSYPARKFIYWQHGQISEISTENL
jgi:DNA helicase HerA-like ATPase